MSMSVPREGSTETGITRRCLTAAWFAAVVFPGAARAAAPTPLTFDTLYSEFGVRGLVFSPTVKASVGKPVSIIGYMAPPLMAEATFFVLTREPLAICPFCQSDADWPSDIVVIRLAGASPLVSAGTRVTVTGTLEVGTATDPDTGFVSQLRIVDAEYRRGP